MRKDRFSWILVAFLATDTLALCYLALRHVLGLGG